MANSVNQLMPVMLFLGLLIFLSLDFTVGQIGVNYGRNGAGLPSPQQVVNLYKQYGIQRMKIYDTDSATIEAVSGSNIELTVGILNKDLQYVSTNAEAWVRDNIIKYQNVIFKHIVVGNEVSPIRNAEFTQYVLPAMQRVSDALSAVGRGGIKVTTQIESEVVDPGTNFPPQKGAFRPEVIPYLDPIIRFLMDTDAPIFVTLYPYLAYIGNPDINLRYALLDPTFEGVVADGVRYQNLFYAILDAVNAALQKRAGAMSLLGVGTDAGKNPPEAKGGETGLPTPPGPTAQLDAITSTDNARMYINNLIQAVKQGTPLRPGQPIETYIFAMFDENEKPGDESERHFGLFTPAGQPKYPVNFN